MTTALEHARPTRPVADFRRYLLARVVSVSGTLITAVALPVLVYRLTGSPGWTSAVAVVEALPYLLFGLVAGALADHVDRRRLMVSADLVSAALLATIPLAWAADAVTAPHIVLVAFAVQSLFVVFDAANFGALPSLVGRDRLTTAYASVYGATTLAELLVPPLAGLVVTVVSPAALLAVDAVTYVASALLIRAITRALSTRRSTVSGFVVHDVRDGLTFLWRHGTVRVLTLVGVTHAVGTGAWISLLVPWADRVLGVAPSGDARLAVLMSCWGVGALAASRLTPPLVRRYGAALLALLALPASLACGLGVLVASHWLITGAAASAWGVTATIVVINGVSYRQQVTPDELQSRVNTTARMLAWGLGQPLGAMLAGAMTVSVGPHAALGVALGVLALGVAAAWCSPLRAEAHWRRTPPTASGGR
ncbi:MFS transporter [Longimycelium tulufanense]|uniref:MFS transporter n=1 Tax=Longimycelium tulufanense TaxID=907463 RepID=A0A8J3CF59_9PSEU|nr:MFS transporter [Longimycelium tulufanense]GGM58168.1 MFS transporter [Longimycelium tulufanense]